ncbi:conserved hypothetical protein, partial [Ricinus communis]
ERLPDSLDFVPPQGGATVWARARSEVDMRKPARPAPRLPAPEQHLQRSPPPGAGPGRAMQCPAPGVRALKPRTGQPFVQLCLPDAGRAVICMHNQHSTTVVLPARDNCAPRRSVLLPEQLPLCARLADAALCRFAGCAGAGVHRRLRQTAQGRAALLVRMVMRKASTFAAAG